MKDSFSSLTLPNAQKNRAFDAMQALCLTLNGIVDYLGQPYQVEVADNPTLSRLVPSADSEVVELFKHRYGGNQEKHYEK